MINYDNYMQLAINKVISIVKEQNILLAEKDFCKNKNLSKKHHVKSNEFDIEIFLFFKNCKASKELKQARFKFLNYFNARVSDDIIFFSFTLAELDKLQYFEVSDNDKLDKVISKISKLLELSDLNKNNSEAEAIGASLKAQQLLAKYNLEVTDITHKKKDEEVTEIIADVEKGQKWKYQLSTAVANNYRCKSYFKGSTKIIFYGYKSDVLIARRVFIYLLNVGNKLANQYVAECRSSNISTKGLYNCFCLGFLYGVRTELEKSSKALMLVVPKEVSEEYKILSENFGKKNTGLKYTQDITAYESGVLEGKRSLNAQYIEN
ncbi:MAG: DUF2786 domain-containing protein [Clostridia bacterium]